MRQLLVPRLLIYCAFAAWLSAAANSSKFEKDNAMNEQRRVLTLESEIHDGMAELMILAKSITPVAVRYELIVEGDSITRHAGATRVLPGDQHVLSRVRINANTSWCASLKVHQDDGMDYRLVEGSC